MIIERQRIEGWSLGSGVIGHISLSKLAIPETVCVTLLGEPIIPSSFDCFGHPNFTEEQELLFMFKEEAYMKMNGGKYTSLQAEISYEERVFDVPRGDFDTVKGIEKSLTSLDDLNEMLNNRKMFIKSHDEKLEEFVIFGHYLLDQFGQDVMTLEEESGCNLRVNSNVERYETFRRNNSHRIIISNGRYHIPTEGSVCPCCGKKFTISDVKDNPCVCVDGKCFHDSCWRNYRKLTEIDKFTRRLMSQIYKATDYTFELLPNGYWHRDDYSYIPWFLFHTIDGDIKMGWRKRVISIEWQKNFKPFDMEELFGSENVTKWEDGGIRGIHAWGRDKAYDYIKKVLETLHPGYSKWE